MAHQPACPIWERAPRWDPILRTPKSVPLLCCFAGVDWATTPVFRLRFLCRIQIHGGVAGLVLVASPPSFSQLLRLRLPRSRKPTHPPICCSLDVLICRVPGPNTQPAAFTSICFLLPPPPLPPSFEIPTRHSDPVKPRRCSRQP